MEGGREGGRERGEGGEDREGDSTVCSEYIKLVLSLYSGEVNNVMVTWKQPGHVCWVLHLASKASYLADWSSCFLSTQTGYNMPEIVSE